MYDPLLWLLLRPWPTGSDSSPGIVGILDVDPRFPSVFVGLSRKFFQFLELALALRQVPFDGKRIRVVHVDPKFPLYLFS